MTAVWDFSKDESDSDSDEDFELRGNTASEELKDEADMDEEENQ
jgi:hypothetical protein